jgi:asparagine synthase (glutamine-hydrolysing)
MCGLAGALGGAGTDAALAARLAATLAHRGPDGDGAWADPAAGIALGHRRLAIVDLSPTGRQPMASHSGRLVAAYNGEIYNFRRLRALLEQRGCRFTGTSDTEVLLEAVEDFGLEDALARMAGMFALALWDRETRVLHLVRDRLGKKPLYVGRVPGGIVFGSELRALRAHPGFRRELDRRALALYLRYGCIPAPFTIYRDAVRLLPGTRLALDREEVRDLGAAEDLVGRMRSWWSARAVALAGQAEPLELSEEAATDRLEAVLGEAVAERMIADVPLGVFLSGGIDSSAVTALMQAQSATPVETFSIGMPAFGYDEAKDARQVAAHLGTRHHELYAGEAEILAVVPELAGIYDEPFADSSQIPTALVARLARRQVTVALTGDGGDEVFGGYNRHQLVPRLAARMGRVPRPLRRAAAGLATALAPPAWDRVFARLDPLLPRRLRQPEPGARLHKLAALLPLDDPEAMYRRLVSHWQAPEEVVLGGCEPPLPLVEEARRAGPDGLAERMMLQDTVSYLPDDILTKVDRATMAVGLEARAPLLDHRVVEFAWRLPLALKIRGGTGKWLLRRLLARHLPPALFERPKQGFAVPLAAWLRGPLRGWAEALLDETRLRQEGLLDPGPVRVAWAEHLTGRRDRAHELWNVLMLQAWRERWPAED